MTYCGNPNVKITAINTGGVIVCSRTSGQTPCFVQVSASAIACTGVVVNTDGSTNASHSVIPYEDLEYGWDFGDPGGTEIFTNPVTDASVNANSAQCGPEAAYVYRSSGTYTVTLTIRGKNGSGFTTAQVTQDITVTAFNASDGTYYFDSVGGSDASDGLTALTPKQSISAVNSAIAINRRILLKRGSSWVGATGISFTGPLRIEAYGIGANPIINISSGGNICLGLNFGGLGVGTVDDFVASNLDLVRSGSKTNELFRVLVSDPNATVSNIYLDNCNLSSDNSSGTGGFWASVSWGGNGTDGSLISKFGIWGGSITATATDTARALGFYGGARSWNFFLGFSLDGTGNNSVLDHHLYPDFQDHGLYKWINFGQGTTRSYCFNIAWNPQHNGVTQPSAAQYHLISECNCTGTDFWHDATDSDNTGPTKAYWQNFVASGNAVHDLRVRGALFFGIATATWRDNIVWNVPDSMIDFGGLVLADTVSPRIYRNLVYCPSGTSSAIINFGNATYTLPCQITDNIFYGTQTAARLVSVSATSQQSAGAIIDRNTYYGPSDTDGKLWYDSSAAKTLAEWRAFGFDVNGSVANPNWTDAANGVLFVAGETFPICGSDLPPSTSTPVGRPTRRYHDSDIFEKQPRAFSRQYFNELKAAEAAQQAAQERAERIKSRQAKQALNRAAQEAAEAIAHAKENEVDLARMTAALEAARGASDLAETIRQADLAIQYAKEIQDTEDEAIALLMLH